MNSIWPDVVLFASVVMAVGALAYLAALLIMVDGVADVVVACVSESGGEDQEAA